MSGTHEQTDDISASSNARPTGATPERLIEELVERVLDVLSQVLPASTLNRFSAQISPAINAVLAPFQILRRGEFEGYVAQLERLEDEIATLREQLAQLSQQGEVD